MAKTTSRPWIEALVDAGVLTEEQRNDTERVVIDITYNDVRIYIKRFADAKTLEHVAPLLKGMLPDG